MSSNSRLRTRFNAGIAAAAVLVAIALLATGCGSDPPVKIGSVAALSGPIAELGPAINDGAELAVQQVNLAGGVLGGRMLDLLTEDGATDPVVAVEAARKLVDIDGISVLIGPLASGVSTAVANAVTVPNNIPQISPSATSPSLTVLEDNDYLFRTAVSDDVQGTALAQLAVELGYASASVMYINDAYGQGLSARFAEVFAELGGNVMELVPHEESQPTYASELARATEDNPDVLVVVSFPVSAAVYVREAVESGLADTFLFVDGSKSTDLIDSVGGSVLEGMYGTAPGSADSPAKDQVLAEFEALHGYPVGATPFVTQMYDAMALMAFAIEAAGSDDSTAIRDALRGVSNPPGVEIMAGADEIKRGLELIRSGQDINYQGISGPVDIDDNGDVSGQIEIWRITGGAIVQDRVITVE